MTSSEHARIVFLYHDRSEDPKLPVKLGQVIKLYSVSPATLKPRQSRSLLLGFKLIIPDGYYAEILPNPELALVWNLSACRQILDSLSQSEEVQVILHNMSRKKIIVNPRAWIASLIVQKSCPVNIVTKEEFGPPTSIDDVE